MDVGGEVEWVVIWRAYLDVPVFGYREVKPLTRRAGVGL